MCRTQRRIDFDPLHTPSTTQMTQSCVTSEGIRGVDSETHGSDGGPASCIEMHTVNRDQARTTFSTLRTNIRGPS